MVALHREWLPIPSFPPSPWFDLATLDLPFSIYSFALVVAEEREREQEKLRQQIKATNWSFAEVACTLASFLCILFSYFLSAFIDKHVCVSVPSVLLVPHQNTLIRFTCEKINAREYRITGNWAKERKKDRKMKLFTILICILWLQKH